jgi:hypothetical protein
MSGNLTYSATMTANATGTVTMTSTSGTKTITTNGITVANNFVFDGVGGTFQLADALNQTGTLIITNGTFDTNNKNITTLGIASNNSNTRTVTFGSSQITVTGQSLNWFFATTTGLTFNAGTSKISFSYAGATSITIDNGSGLVYNDISITGNGSGTLTFAQDLTCRDLLITTGTRNMITSDTTARNVDWTGFNGTWGIGSGTLTLTGNLTLSGGMGVGNEGLISFIGTSGTQMITSNGNNNGLSSDVEINTPGAIVQLADSLVVDGALILTAGTFDNNTNDLSVTALESAAFGNNRTLIIANCIVEVNSNDGNDLVWNTVDFSTLAVSAAGSEIRTFGGIWSSDFGLTLNDFVWDSTVPLQFSSFDVDFRDITFNDTGDDGTGYPFSCYQVPPRCRNFDMSGVTQFSKPFLSNLSIGISGNLNVGDMMIFGDYATFFFGGFSGTQMISGTSNMSIVDLSVDTSGSTIVQFNNDISFHNLLVYSGASRVVKWKSGATHTINGQITAVGTAVHLHTFSATTPGVPAILSSPGNNISIEYVNITDLTVTGGARWFAGKHSINNGGNHGWRFTDLAPRSSAGSSSYLFI